MPGPIIRFVTARRYPILAIKSLAGQIVVEEFEPDLNQGPPVAPCLLPADAAP